MGLRLCALLIACWNVVSALGQPTSFRRVSPEARIRNLRAQVDRARRIDRELTQLLEHSPVRAAVLRSVTGAAFNRALWESSTEVTVTTLTTSINRIDETLRAAHPDSDSIFNPQNSRIDTRLSLAELLAEQLNSTLRQRFDILQVELRAAGYVVVAGVGATAVVTAVVAAPAALVGARLFDLFSSVGLHAAVPLTLAQLSPTETARAPRDRGLLPPYAWLPPAPDHPAAHRRLPNSRARRRNSANWQAYRRALGRLRALERRVREEIRDSLNHSPLLTEAVTRLIHELPNWQASLRPPAGLGDLAGILTSLEIAFSGDHAQNRVRQVYDAVSRADAAQSDSLPREPTPQDLAGFSAARQAAQTMDWGETLSEWARALLEQHPEAAVPQFLGLPCATSQNTLNPECLGWMALLKIEGLERSVTVNSAAETSALTQALGFDLASENLLHSIFWFQDPSGRRWNLLENRLISENQSEAWHPILNSAELGWRLLERLYSLSPQNPAIARAFESEEARAVWANRESVRNPIIPLLPSRLPPRVTWSPPTGSIQAHSSATPAAPDPAEYDDTLPLRDAHAVFTDVAHALERWNATDVPPENLFELILEADRFFIRSNTPTAQEWPYLVGRWRSMVRRTRAAVDAMGESGRETEKIQTVRNLGVDLIIKNYFRDSGSVIRALRGQGTNCQGNTALLTGLLAAVHVKPQTGERYVLNHYIDHVELAVLNNARREIWVPLSNELQQGAVAWVYRAPMLLWSVLERGISRGLYESNPVTLASLFIANPRGDSPAMFAQGHGLIDLLRMAWETGFRIPESTYGLPLSLGMLFRGLTSKPSYIPQRAQISQNGTRSNAHRVQGDRRVLSSGGSGGGGSGSGDGASAPQPGEPFPYPDEQMQAIRQVPSNLFRLTHDALMLSLEVTYDHQSFAPALVEPAFRRQLKVVLESIPRPKILSPRGTTFDPFAAHDVFAELRGSSRGVNLNEPLDQSCSRFGYQVVQARIRRAERENECRIQFGATRSDTCKHLDLVYLAESVRLDLQFLSVWMDHPQNPETLQRTAAISLWSDLALFRAYCAFAWVKPALDGRGEFPAGNRGPMASNRQTFRGQIYRYDREVKQPMVGNSAMMEQHLFGDLPAHLSHIEGHYYLPFSFWNAGAGTGTSETAHDQNRGYCRAESSHEGERFGRKPLLLRLLEGESIPNAGSAGRIPFPTSQRAIQWRRPGDLGAGTDDGPFRHANDLGYCEIAVARSLIQNQIVSLANRKFRFPKELEFVTELGIHLVQDAPQSPQGEIIRVSDGGEFDRPPEAVAFAPGIWADLARVWVRFRDANITSYERPWDDWSTERFMPLDESYRSFELIHNPHFLGGAQYPAFVRNFWDSILRVARPVVVPRLVDGTLHAIGLLRCEPLVAKLNVSLGQSAVIQNYEHSFTPDGFYVRTRSILGGWLLPIPMHADRLAVHRQECARIRQQLMTEATALSSGDLQSVDQWIQALRQPSPPPNTTFALENAPPSANGVEPLIAEITHGRIGILIPPREDTSQSTPDEPVVAIPELEVDNSFHIPIPQAQPAAQSTTSRHQQAQALDRTRVALPPAEYARVIVRLLDSAATSPENRAALLARLLHPALRLSRREHAAFVARLQEWRTLALRSLDAQTTAGARRLVAQARNHIRDRALLEAPVTLAVPTHWLSNPGEAAAFQPLGLAGPRCSTVQAEGIDGSVLVACR